MAAQHFSGVGAPNGVVFGNPGDIYQDETGAFWIKASGVGTNTGWVAISVAPTFTLEEVTSVDLAASTEDVLTLAAITVPVGRKLTLWGAMWFAYETFAPGPGEARVTFQIIRSPAEGTEVISNSQVWQRTVETAPGYAATQSCMGDFVGDGNAHVFALRMIVDPAPDADPGTLQSYHIARATLTIAESDV